MGDLKATSIKAAIANWQENHNEPISEAKYVDLQFQWPPIQRMDNNLSVLSECQKLSLSTNMIEKISGLSTLKNLKILSLARNNIKSFVGLEHVADTLEELWISFNEIEQMKGILGMHKLKVLHMSNNNVKAWDELQKLNELESLQDLLLVGNPLYDSMEESVWRNECTKKLPKIAILDTIPVIRN